MKSLPCIRRYWVALILLTEFLCVASMGQSRPQLLASTEGPTVVRSVRLLSSSSGPAVEILSSRPLVPTIATLDNPPRLVIDLPNALLTGNSQRINVAHDEINRLRVNQFQNDPPITRVVLDLAKPVTQTWDAAGNRLMVRLHASDDATAKPPSAPVFIPVIEPVAVPLGPGSRGAIVLAGNHIAAGSSLTAGSETSIMRLARGGEVRVCPGTTVSVTASQSGHALMLGMSTGAMEAHYRLDASADSILTPDFRVLLAGPGEFHYAISADSRGNTCVRALPGNTASVIVAELLGDGNYQVKPNEQVVFRSGKLSLVDGAVPVSCGCPPPSLPLLRAAAPPDPRSVKLDPSSAMRPAQPEESLDRMPSPGVPSSGALPPETAALPPSKPNDVHIQVDAPFVFRASDLPPAKPAPVRQTEVIKAADLPQAPSFQIAALPPARQSHHGVFGKIKGFFAAIFS